MEMIIVTEAFALENNGKPSGSNNKFNAVKLNNGSYACAINSQIDFPELFEGIDIVIQNLSATDFKDLVLKR
jgi:hypothetical protein